MEFTDEDVVFENSPLYSHLKEVGFTEFQPEPIASLQDSINRKEKTATRNMWQKFKESCMVGAITQFLSLISILFWKKIEDFWHNTLFSGKIRNFSTLYVKLLMYSNLVLEEDVRFLKRFDPSSFVFEGVCYDNLSVHISKAKGAQKFHRHKLLGSSFMSALVLIIAVLCSFSNLTLLFNSGYFIVIFVGIFLLTTVCGLILLKCWSVYQWYSTCLENSLMIKEYIEMMKLLYSQLRKAILLIQEVELISRGFTVFTPGTPISRMENNLNAPARQFVNLRKIVLQTAKSLILSCRERTSLLLEKFPLSCEVDSDEMYITKVPLKSLGPFFDEVLQESALRDVTNEYSLESLKTIFNLLQVQQSEFVRRFLLTLSSASYESVSNHDKRKMNSIICSLFKAIVDPGKDLSNKLTQSYEFHKTRIADSIKPKERAHQKCEGNKWSPMIFVTHSLDLHLQVILSKLRSFENIIDRLENSYEDMSTDDEYMEKVISHKDKEQLNALYTQVKSELDAVKECWEVGSVKLKILLGADQEDFSPIENEEKYPFDSQPGIQESSAEFTVLDDPEPSDQIFEGYNETDEAECDGWNETVLTATDLEREKQEREENRRMMKELKSILHAKANPEGIGLISFDKPLFPPTDRKTLSEHEKSDCEKQNNEQASCENSVGNQMKDLWNELSEKPTECLNELDVQTDQNASGMHIKNNDDLSISAPCKYGKEETPHNADRIPDQNADEILDQNADRIPDQNTDGILDQNTDRILDHRHDECTNIDLERNDDLKVLLSAEEQTNQCDIFEGVSYSANVVTEHSGHLAQGTGFATSLAKSVAIAAAAKSKSLGLSEQQFEGEGFVSDEELEST